MTSRKSRERRDGDGWTTDLCYFWMRTQWPCHKNIWGPLTGNDGFEIICSCLYKSAMNVWPGRLFFFSCFFFVFFWDINYPLPAISLIAWKTGETHGCQWQDEKSYGFVENPTTKSLDCRKQYLESLSSCPQTRFFSIRKYSGNTSTKWMFHCYVTWLPKCKASSHYIRHYSRMCSWFCPFPCLFWANCSISVFGFCQDETSWTGTSPACKVPALQQLMQDRHKASNGSTSCQQSRI